ncbi:glutamine amidotransferase-related protein, partial [Staphylococcus aureus]|uniref:flagellar motor switch protein FliN n=1 Tax=Staphylococcus aureus TaxID=1280 RepID=UPI0039BE4825
EDLLHITKGTLYRLENSTKNTVRLMLENEEIGTGKILTKNGKMYVEIVELKDHPWFVAAQFHPELVSRPNRPQPLFHDFVRASITNKESK